MLVASTTTPNQAAGTSIYKNGAVFPDDVAVDAMGNVFLTNPGMPGTNPPSGTVVELPFGGGAPITIVSSITAPYRIEVDAQYVYFTNLVGDGGLYRNVKTPGADVEEDDVYTAVSGIAAK